MSKKTVLFLYLARMVPEKQQPYSIYPVSLRESTPVKSGIWGNVLTENLPIHYQRSALRSIEGRRIFSQLSVRENLMMGAYLCRDNAKIKRNLEYVFTLFPRLLEREKQMGGTLSGGEQQMLAVGRALMQDPKLLMMDEPSLGLAPLLIEEVFRAIKKIKEDGLPILLVEQNSKAALQVADRGYVLEVGELVLEDTAENLLHNEAIKKSYLGMG